MFSGDGLAGPAFGSVEAAAPWAGMSSRAGSDRGREPWVVGRMFDDRRARQPLGAAEQSTPTRMRRACRVWRSIDIRRHLIRAREGSSRAPVDPLTGGMEPTWHREMNRGVDLPQFRRSGKANVAAFSRAPTIRSVGRAAGSGAPAFTRTMDWRRMLYPAPARRPGSIDRVGIGSGLDPTAGLAGASRAGT
jgi:hypothetical protein